jgi:hypothetical protein
MIIQRGWAKVTSTTEDGHEVVLAVRGPGELVCEGAAPAPLGHRGRDGPAADPGHPGRALHRLPRRVPPDVARALKVWRARGLVRTERRKIITLDLPGLHDYAGDRGASSARA